MSIFDKIKILWTARGVVEEIAQEAKMPTASGKPGYLTTEFWLNIATQIGVLWGAVHSFVPPQIAAIITIAGTAIYTVARTVAKAVTDIQSAKAAQGAAVAAGPDTATATATVSTK